MSSSPSDLGIGIVGAGLIVQNAHLPAYRNAGLRVIGITDANEGLARDIAREWGIRAFASVDDLLADPAVQVVDIAITPEAQGVVARQAFAAGKPVLAQKPLASDLRAARALVDDAERAGVPLAVNQQLRWSPAVRAFKDAIRDGFLGDPVTLQYHVDIPGEYAPDHWLSHLPRFMASYGTIHYIDSARHLFGEPSRVTARLLRDPEQVSAGETFINAWIEWESGPRLIVFERYTNRAPSEPSWIRLDGTRGAVRAHLGIYDDYPRAIPDVIERTSFDDPRWVDVSDGTTWLPDAFAGPMTGLIEAVASGSLPPTDGRDNLRTLRIVDALYRSDAEGRTIELDT